MSKTKEKFVNFVEYTENLPIHFTYNGIEYQGIGGRDFQIVGAQETDEGGKKTVIKEFLLLNELKITVSFAFYSFFDAYEYTVYFENVTDSDSGIL